ncbi:MAG: histidine phosphatase family protein, partial [Myxococcales bacterium]|nr:histidine phosphatase family protein [Myxococcales bacterium]
AARVLQTPEVPLSERGRAQARRVAERLRAHPIARVVASDLARAVETAEAIRAATGAPLSLDPLLRERDFGELRGTAYADLAVDPFAPGFVPPGGEGVDVFHARADAAWEAVARGAEGASGDVVVVTHGLVCRAWVERVLGVAGDALARHAFANTCVTEVAIERPWRALRIACAAHLEDAAAGPGAAGPALSASRPGGRA